jgi:plasmid maintenance system antidote protein VapI
MIGWQIMKVQSTLFEQKGIDGLPFVPPRIIYPEVNDLSFEAGQDLLKEFEETTGITFNGFHQTMKAVQRINPSKEIQSLLVLTAGVHVGLDASLDPDPSQFWMHAEARFILKKKHSLPSTLDHQVEFFLASCENFVSLLPTLERTDRSVVLKNTPTCESSAAHDAHGWLSDGVALDILRPLPHPTSLWISPPVSESWTGFCPIPLAPSRQYEQVVRIEGGPRSMPTLSGWHFLSNSLPQDGLNRRVPQPEWTSTQIASANTLQYESLSMPQESSQLFPTTTHGLSQGALCSELSSFIPSPLFELGGTIP